MHAALVTSYDSPPAYAVCATPRATGPHDVVVDVVAAGLHPRVRSQADGSHYTTSRDRDALPLVPGIDGVGRLPDGRLCYFVLPDTTLGSMAEQTVVDARRTVELPAGCDPVTVAAAMNPAMSSWLALRERIAFSPGQKVLVLGATGNAGQLAVQVARHLGAAEVVALGRDDRVLERLGALGATDVVSLRQDPADLDRQLATIAGDVDVVLDYVWGDATAATMTSLVTHRVDDSRPLTWVEIGSVAAPVAALPSAAFRATTLQLVGSGQGSVSPHEILAELPALVAAITDGTLPVSARAVPLADVAAAWADRTTSERVVLTPAG